MHILNTFSAIILDTALKATVLLLLAWGGVLILKSRSAAMRHAVLAFAVAALLLLPFSSAVLPAWHVKGVPEFNSTASTATTPEAQSPPAAIHASQEAAAQAPVASTRRVRAALTAAKPRHGSARANDQQD